MLQFLHDHPHVTQVSLCLGNNKAGMVGMERLENAIREDPELSRRVKLIYRTPPLCGAWKGLQRISLRPYLGGAAETTATRRGDITLMRLFPALNLHNVYC